MAKEEKNLSFDDFLEENLLDGLEEEEELEDQEDQEEEESPKKEKKKSQKPPVDEVEEEEEEEEEVVEEKEPTATTEDEETEDEEEEVDSSAFFEQVEKITGISLEDLDYKGVDPLSPEGVALREKAVMEYAVDNFLEELQKTHPKVFNAMQYAYAGRDIAELFEGVARRDYRKVSIGDDDENLAKQILTEYYEQKGIKSPERIRRLIQTDEESEEGLIQSARSMLEELQAEQARQEDEKLEQAKRERQEQEKRDKVFIASLDDVLESGKLETFQLAGKQEVSEFKKYLLSRIHRGPDNTYQLVTTIEPGKVEKILQAEYFRFKGGDLSRMVQIKAGTENAKKLRLRLNKDKKKKAATTEVDTKTTLSMKDFYANQ